MIDPGTVPKFVLIATFGINTLMFFVGLMFVVASFIIWETPYSLYQMLWAAPGIMLVITPMVSFLLIGGKGAGVVAATYFIDIASAVIALIAFGAAGGGVAAGVLEWIGAVFTSPVTTEAGTVDDADYVFMTWMFWMFYIPVMIYWLVNIILYVYLFVTQYRRESPFAAFSTSSAAIPRKPEKKSLSV